MNRPLPQSRVPLLAGPSHSTSTVGEVLAGVEPPTPVASVYLHVPFCFHKCHYCDFYSLVDTRDRQPAYLERALREIDANAGAWRRLNGWRDSLPAGESLPDNQFGGAFLETVFVGGGTPTLLRPDLLARLLSGVAESFPIDPPRTEFTVEANPETVTDEVAEVLAGSGVNRVSIGAQSFNPGHLKTLERWHDPESVPRAIERLRAAGITNLNLDLIFGIPGQTLDEWISDLEQAIALAPMHLSCYSLTYEPNTAMTARMNAGEFDTIDEDLETEMFLTTRAFLRDQAFEAYEISNFARRSPKPAPLARREGHGEQRADGQDFRCRHNLAYWRNENWLAIGPSASGHVGNRRWKVTPHLATYLRDDLADENGFPPAIDIECADPATRLAERTMMGMRLAEGMPLDELLNAADAFGRAEALKTEITRGIDHGWLDHRSHEDRIALTETGLLLANTVIGDLMEAVSLYNDATSGHSDLPHETKMNTRSDQD